MTKNKNQSLLPWLMWSLAAAFYFYEFLLQVSPNVMVPELMRTFQLSAAALGNLTACYFYAYASMQIPSGILLDHYGPKRLLTLATLLCAIGCLIFGTATHLYIAQIGRLLIGFGGAFAVLGSFKLIANWFPSDRFAFMSSLTVTIGMLGAIGGQTPLAVLVDWIDWRASLVILGLLGGFLALQIWRNVEDSPVKTTPLSEKTEPLFQGIKEILRSKQNWLTAIYGGLMFAPTSILGALWGVPFIVATYGISRPAAAGIISTLFIGWAVGCPISGFVADYLKKREQVLWIGSIGALCMLTIFIYVHLPLFLLSLTLFAFGFFSSGFLPSFAIIREINRDESSATALGFMNMLNMLGGALGQPFIGWLLDKAWDGAIENHLRIYSATDFKLALMPLPIGLVIAIIVLLLLHKKHQVIRYPVRS